MPTSKELKDLDSQLKKTVISAESFKRSSSLDVSKNIVNIHKTISNLAGHVRKVVIRVGDLEKRADNNSRKITSLKNISALQGPQIRGTNIGSKLPGSSVQNVDKNIAAITKSVSSIAEILSGEKKLNDATSAYEKRKAEQEKRGLAESKLEKRFEGLKRIAERIIAPVKSLLDRIIEFFTTILLGNIVLKLINWFSNEENANKVRSLIRFVKDWWPALLGAYILFGNSFSGFIRGTIGMVGRFIFQLGKAAIPQLLKLATNPYVAVPAVFAGMGVLANEVTGQRKAAPVQAENKAKAQTGRGLGVGGVGGVGDMGPTTPYGLLQGAAGGGLLRAFSGGGFNFGGFVKFFSGFGKFFSGFVSGEKGVDKIPAMLSDGEFVMSRGAVAKYGVDTLESMNAAGGGTNKPKILSGVPYAAGGGLIGGVDELRRRYDQKQGPGAYDKESARRRSEYNKIESPREAITRLRSYEGPAKATVTPSTPKAPKISIQSPNITLPVDPKREAEREARKKARAEYLSVIKNMDHPDYDKAWNDPNYMKNLRQKYLSQSPTATRATAPKSTSSSSKPGSEYTPYKSKFAGYRDAAFARAQRIGEQPGINPYNPMTWGRPGGVFGGPRMQARTDYAASKGKYYSSSDQKTYGNYNDAMAAKKSRMTSLASQQRLNKLSSQGAGPRSGRGIRYTTEAVASERERINRGGTWGQISRGWMNAFGSNKDRQNIAAQDKASQARVKQAGAASIGRYYSSSDGKYYKDYNAAKLAQQQRKKSGVKPPVKPKPKYNPAGGGMGGGRGSKGKTSKAKTPTFSASTKGSKTKADLIGVHR